MAMYKVKYRKSYPGTRITPREFTVNQNATSTDNARVVFRQQHRDTSREKYEVLSVEKVERK